jgi:hypothetical protein
MAISMLRMSYLKSCYRNCRNSTVYIKGRVRIPGPLCWESGNQYYGRRWNLPFKCGGRVKHAWQIPKQHTLKLIIYSFRFSPTSNGPASVDALSASRKLGASRRAGWSSFRDAHFMSIRCSYKYSVAGMPGIGGAFETFWKNVGFLGPDKKEFTSVTVSIGVGIRESFRISKKEKYS